MIERIYKKKLSVKNQMTITHDLISLYGSFRNYHDFLVEL